MHIIRGGLNYSMELRFLGRRCVRWPMPCACCANQVARCAGSCSAGAREVGGFTEHQFAELRLPTIEELTARRRRTAPVFVLHLYDRADPERRGVAARSATTRKTPNPPGGEIVRDARGNPTGAGCRPSPAPPSSTPRTAQGPRSCRPSIRRIRRATSCRPRCETCLGVTGVIDAGGGYQSFYPEDYSID
ncbi:amidohydrolase family protein [Cupriavidus basilensis]